MDEKKTPYLFKSGIKFDFNELKTATEFNVQVSLKEEDKFLNGMMKDLVKNLSFLSNDMFFSLIKSIVPLHVLNDYRFPLCSWHKT